MYIYIIIDDVDEMTDGEIKSEHKNVWHGPVGELIW